MLEQAVFIIAVITFKKPPSIKSTIKWWTTIPC